MSRRTRHTVREFVEAAFEYVISIERCEHDERYERPAEVDLLLGDVQGEENSGLGTQGRFQELVHIMVDADVELLSRTPAQQHLGKPVSGESFGPSA